MAKFNALLLVCCSIAASANAAAVVNPRKVDESAASIDSISATNLWPTLPKSMVPLYTKEGQTFFYSDKTEARDTALRMLGSLETQQTQTFCGIATAVTALNSLYDLRKDAPLDTLYYPYSYYTQNSLFNSKCAVDVIPPATVLSIGTTLPEMVALLKCYVAPEHVEAAHALEKFSSVNKMREFLTTALNDPNKRVLMNYLRKEFGGGHWSPIGAYNSESDRFLILDVERYLYPPIWMTAQDVFEAVSTTDSDSKKSRGFVVISE